MSWSRSCLQWLEALLCPSSSRRAAVKSGPGHSFIHLQFLFWNESSWWLESTAPGGQQFCTTRLFHCTGPHCLWTTHQLQKCQWDSSHYTTVGRKTGYNVDGVPWADLLWCRKTCLSASGTFWKHTLCLYSRKKKNQFSEMLSYLLKTHWNRKPCFFFFPGSINNLVTDTGVYRETELSCCPLNNWTLDRGRFTLHHITSRILI